VVQPVEAGRWQLEDVLLQAELHVVHVELHRVLHDLVARGRLKLVRRLLLRLRARRDHLAPREEGELPLRRLGDGRELACVGVPHAELRAAWLVVAAREKEVVGREGELAHAVAGEGDAVMQLHQPVERLPRGIVPHDDHRL